MVPTTGTYKGYLRGGRTWAVRGNGFISTGVVYTRGRGVSRGSGGPRGGGGGGGSGRMGGVRYLWVLRWEVHGQPLIR